MATEVTAKVRYGHDLAFGDVALGSKAGDVERAVVRVLRIAVARVCKLGAEREECVTSAGAAKWVCIEIDCAQT